MKLIVLLSSVLFAGFAHADRHSTYSITCAGTDHDGTEYRLKVDYTAKRNAYDIMTSDTIVLDDRDVTATLEAYSDGEMIYNETTALDSVKARVSGDIRVVTFSN